MLQEELARSARIARRTVSRIETGHHPSPDTRKAIDCALSTSGPPDASDAECETLLVALGNLMRRIRKEQGIRLVDAARSLRISVSQLSRLERGEAAPRALFDVGEEGDYELRSNAWHSIYYQKDRDLLADTASGDGTRRGAFRRV